MSDVNAERSAGTKYTTMSVIQAALNKEPGSARIAYDQLVLDRAFQLVQDKRQEIAAEFGKTGYFGNPSGEEEDGATDISGEMGGGTGETTPGEGDAGDAGVGVSASS